MVDDWSEKANELLRNRTFPQSILACDPGGTSGFAVGIDYGLEFSFIRAGELKCSPFDLFALLQSIRPGVIVAESFLFRNNVRPGTELISRNLLGVCEMWAESNNCPLVYQNPGDAKGSFPNERLKLAGAYTTGSEHARDATRHLFHFAWNGKGAKIRVQNGARLSPGVHE
jgi:hypothetical protein